MSTLGKVCEINPPKSEIAALPDDLDVSFVPMAAISEDGRLLEAKTKKVKVVKKGFPHFKERDVLIAKITPCFENGKRWLANSLTNGVGFGSTEFHVLRTKMKVTPEWVYYFVSLPELRRQGQRKMTGTAGQKRVPASFLGEYRIPVPPIPVQEKIVLALRRAERLKETRELANRLTGKIIESVFLKMFGDEFSIVNAWEWFTIQQCTDKIIDYRGKTPPKTSSGIPLITAKIVRNGEIREPTEFIATEYYNRWMVRGLPRYGDVLFTSEAPLGNVAQVKSSGRIALAQRIILLRGKEKVIDNRFLVHALLHPTVRSDIESRATGSTVKGIRQAQLRNVRIPVPPLELQEKFGKVSDKIDTLRQHQSQSTQETSELFNSLLQRAFSGELKLEDIGKRIVSPAAATIDTLGF